MPSPIPCRNRHRIARAPFGCSHRPAAGARLLSSLPWRAAMRASTLRLVVGDVTYLMDDPKADNGIKASISAVRDEVTVTGSLSRILHCDRINLDKAREREAFAERAG